MPDFQKVLGLDLGTNSIGFAIRNLTVRGEGEDIAFKAIEKAGVTIFPTPMNMEKGKEIGSLASVRTLLRSMRKRLQRKRIRKIELLQELINLKMVPLTQAELDAYKRRGTYPKENKAFVAWLKMDFNRSGKPNFLSPYEVPESTKETLGRNWADYLVSPYQLRALAIENPDAITPEMLGRIAYHFIQRRGYASNRKDQPKPETSLDDTDLEVEKPTKKSKKGDGEQAANADDGKKVLGAIKDYEELLKASGLTPGQEIAQRLLNLNTDDGAPERARNRHGSTNKYGRPQLKAEWVEIVKAQGHDPEKDPWKYLETVIFRNRPLKSQKRNIGRCLLEPTKFRMPISHPVFEYFRIWQTVNNVRYGLASEGTTSRTLTSVQQNQLAKSFIVSSNFPGKSLRSKVADVVQVKNIQINYGDADTLSGSPFLYQAKTLLGEERFEAMYQLAIDRLKVEEQQINGEGPAGHPEWADLRAQGTDLFQLWQWLFEADTDEDAIRLKERLERLFGLNDKQSTSLWNSIKEGYGRLSLRATLNILWMMELGYRYDEAVLFAKVPKLVGPAIWKSKGDTLLQELESSLQQARERNVAIGIANDWLSGYNRSIDPKSETDKPYRLDPTTLGIEEKAEIKKLIKRYHDGLADEAKQKLQAQVEGLVSDRLKIGTMGQADFSKVFFKLYTKSTNLEVVTDFLVGNFDLDEAKVQKQLYHHSDVETVFRKIKGQADNELPSPITSSLKNPVVLRALNQLRRLINHLIRTGAIDPSETAIQLEMGRDLNTANMRAAIQRYQKKQEEEKETAKKKIAEYFTAHKIEHEVNEMDILKYRLWIEQNGKCLYTDRPINITELLSGIDFDIEHTIPQSRYPDSEMENLTICDSSFNRQVKKATFPADLTSFVEIEKRLEVYRKKADAAHEVVERKKKAIKGASTKEGKDKAMVEKHVAIMEREYWKTKLRCFTTPEAKFSGGFRKRQALDTAMINKYAIRFLKQQFELVRGSKGSVTALVRKAWQLVEDGEKKDRSFHYHHAEDAILQTLLYQQGGENGPYRLVAELSRGEGILYQRHKASLDKVFDYQNAHDKIKQILGSREYTPYGLVVDRLRHVVKSITDNVLVNHAPVRSPLKQTKRVVRDKSGKILKDKDGNRLFTYGTGVRVPLFESTWYGLIQVKEFETKTEEDNNLETTTSKVKDSETKTLTVKYRKTISVTGLVTNGPKGVQNHISNIIDPTIRQIAEAIGPKAFLEGLTYMEIPVSIARLERDPNALPQRVYKVKIFTKQANPIAVKSHQNPLGLSKEKSTSEKKSTLWGAKGTNLLCALIVNEKGKRSLAPISPDQINPKLSVEANLVKLLDLKPTDKILHVFMKGQLVLFLEKGEKKLDLTNRQELRKRIFKVDGFEGDTRRVGNKKIIFSRADTGMNNDLLRAYYSKILLEKVPDTYITGHSEFLLEVSPLKLNLSSPGITCLPIDGKILDLTPSGEITIVADLKDWLGQ